MKKLILLAGLLVGSALWADVLYWQVGSDTVKDYPTVSEARLRVVGVDEAVQYAFVSAEANPVMTRTAFDFEDLSGFGVKDPTEQSFYVELYAFNEGTQSYDLQAFSAAASYKSLKDFMASSIMSVPLTAWGGGTFTAAPEPTGGLLMLIGLGLIGLRRRPVA